MIAKHQIAHNSKHGSINNLKDELANGPTHIFGNHTKCCEYYCKERNTEDFSLSNTLSQLTTSGLFQRIEGYIFIQQK